MGRERESCEQLEMELETLEIHLQQTLQQVVNGSHNPYSPLLLSVCNKWSFAANPYHGMRSKLAREEEEENSEMNDTKACFPKPKEKVQALQEYMDNFFSDSSQTHNRRSCWFTPQGHVAFSPPK
jgi:hypothetical protein